MPPNASENALQTVLRHVGLRGAVIVALGVVVLGWGLAHVAASPGTEVSVLWGLARYTKSKPTMNDERGRCVAALDTAAMREERSRFGSSPSVSTSDAGVTRGKGDSADLDEPFLLEFDVDDTTALYGGLRQGLRPIGGLISPVITQVGIYTFVPAKVLIDVFSAGSLGPLLETSLNRKRAHFEVHFLPNKKVHLLGFVDARIASFLPQHRTERGVEFTVFPEPTMISRVAVLIPLQRVTRMNWRTLTDSPDATIVLQVAVK